MASFKNFIKEFEDKPIADLDFIKKNLDPILDHGLKDSVIEPLRKEGKTYKTSPNDEVLLGSVKFKDPEEIAKWIYDNNAFDKESYDYYEGKYFDK